MSHFNLQDEVQALAEGSYTIENEVPARSIDGALDSAIDSISDSAEAITVPIVFDAFRSGLKHAQQLEGTQLSKIQDALSSAFRAELEATARDGQDLSDSAAYRSHKTALEMYAFLSMWFVQVAEKYVNTARAGDEEPAAAKKKTAKGKGRATKSKGDFAWADSIPAVLALFAKALRLKTERIWQTTQERDSFVGCFTRPANRLAEVEAYMKNVDTRMAVFKVICIAAKSHGQSFATQIMIMQNMTAYEHLPEPMAELVHILATEFDLSQIGEEVLREIADKPFTGGTDAKSQKPFPRFLIKLSELMPRLIHKQMVVLQRHLDSESYHMRNAIIEVISNLIKDVANSEDEGEPGSQKRDLDNYFGLLFDRFLDLNGFVRSKVVTIFSRILDNQSNRFSEARLRLTALAVRSLEDKTSTVRKNCLALLIKLILTHPYGALYGGELDLARFEEGYKVVCDELEPMEAPSQEVLDAMRDEQENDEDDDERQAPKVKQEPTSDAEASEDDEDEDSSDEDEPREERQAKKAAAKAERQARKEAGKARKSQVAIDAAVQQIDQEKLGKLRLTKRYYTDAIQFINELHRAMPFAETLLASKMKAEVLESMEFFKTAFEYKLQGAEDGVKKMIHLIWAKDNSTVEDGQELKGIRSRLIECYRSLYFDALKDLSPVENVNRIAKNMICLTFHATLADLTSLEQLMSTMMTENAVHDDVIHKLWQAYSTSKDIPSEQRRGAIIILGQLAIARPEIITENLEYLLKIGLGQHGKSDYLLAKYSCIALVRIGGSQKKVKGSLADQSIRLGMDNAVFDRLKASILNSKVDQEWFGLAEQIINTIYALGEQPDALCSEIIQELALNVFGKAAAQEKQETPEAAAAPAAEGGEAQDDAPEPSQASARMASEQPSMRTQSAEPPSLANAFQLAQLLFAAGHVATRHLLHLELMEREFKRRKNETDKKDKNAAAGAAGGAAADKEELDQVVGSVEDDIADVIAMAKEKELLYGPDSLLAVFGPMAVAVCSQPKLYKNHMLRVAAVSAMSKFMCVSAQFCEEHLMLLFKLLETATNPVIRSNIVIALGDIAVCFSTLMDQNSDRLYAGLTDRDLTVKKNTLMVLTYLILNGMIKVKGQLGEMAKCLEDEEERISSLAKLFFEELSTKENAIYNNLPDIISHLSSSKHAVDEEQYQSIMRYIFRYIDKEKQAESIVDKLCQRFKSVTDERQWRDIAFCMSLLPFKSERSVKRLVEGLPFYQDKLRDDKVYAYFLDILTKARSTKAVKNENDLLEFEKALEEHKRVGQENAAIEQKAQRKTRKKAAAASAAPAKAKSGRARKQISESPPSSP